MTTFPVTSQSLEQKYKEIHEKRLILEAEFARLEKEFKSIMAEAARLKEKADIEKIHTTIDNIN